MLAAVEATLLGKDERLVAKCDVPGILAVFERWDIYDVDTLSANLASSFAELQRDLEPVAARSFLALLKATIGRVPSVPPPDTPSSAPPTTPFHQAPPCFSPPIHPPPPATVPLVVTIKMNGKVLAERTSLPVPPTATWEAVARVRLEAVLDAAEVQAFMSTPLAVSLFPTADHSPSDRVSAATGGAQADGAARGGRQETAQEARTEVSAPLAARRRRAASKHPCVRQASTHMCGKQAPTHAASKHPRVRRASMC